MVTVPSLLESLALAMPTSSFVPLSVADPVVVPASVVVEAEELPTDDVDPAEPPVTVVVELLPPPSSLEQAKRKVAVTNTNRSRRARIMAPMITGAVRARLCDVHAGGGRVRTV
jgi:hypothetical protein